MFLTVVQLFRSIQNYLQQLGSLEDARAEGCQVRDEENVKINIGPHIQTRLCIPMCSLERKGRGESFTLFSAREKQEELYMEIIFGLHQSKWLVKIHKSLNWILILSLVSLSDLQQITFVCVCASGSSPVKWKKYINNNNINNNGNVVLVCKALCSPWLKGTMGVPSIIIWQGSYFKLSVPKGQKRLGSFLLKMSCKYRN